MAGELTAFRFMKSRHRPHTTDLQAAAGWGIAAVTGALWLVQVNQSLSFISSSPSIVQIAPNMFVFF